MKVIETIGEMRRLRLELAEPVGFVSTMGYLHLYLIATKPSNKPVCALNTRR